MKKPFLALIVSNLSLCAVVGFIFRIAPKHSDQPLNQTLTLALSEIKLRLRGTEIPLVDQSSSGSSLTDNKLLTVWKSVGTLPSVAFDVGEGIIDEIMVINSVETCCRYQIQDFTFQLLHQWPDNAVNSDDNVAWQANIDDSTIFHQYVVSFPFDSAANSYSFALLGKNISTASQWEQDLFVIAHFQEKRHGTFIDIGANDGVTFSNSYILEKDFGWTGLLVEPQREHLRDLVLNRSSESSILNACVYNSTHLAKFQQVKSTGGWRDVHGFGEDMLSGNAESWRWDADQMGHNFVESRVPCFHINEILAAYNITFVDYLSIDAEGSDTLIVKAIDWTKFSASVVSVEFHDQENTNDLVAFFGELGYGEAMVAGHDLLFFKS